MGFGQFSLGSVASLMGVNVYNTPASIFDGLLSVSSNLSGSLTTQADRKGRRSGVTAATVGMVSAYINSDFNAYTSYVNRCYEESDEPIAELSSLAPEIRPVTGILKVLDRGTPEQKKKIQDENQLPKSLQEARMIFLHFYYPGAYEQVESVGSYYFEPIPEKEVSAVEEAAPKAKKVSASAKDGFVTTEFGTELAEEAKRQAAAVGYFDLKAVGSALSSKGVSVGGKTAAELADFIAKSDKFVECTDSEPNQLKDIPAGAVVIWSVDGSHSLGSCSIALGDGREASSIIRPQREAFSEKYRLFLPL
ncbi:MAG: hypothetical protein ACI38Q_09550 [Candidatus Bruticola sp.]